MPKLPRRYAQRQALQSRRQEARSHSQPQVQRLSSSDDESDINELSEQTTVSYRQMIAEFREAGPVISNLGDSALSRVASEQRRWDRFCNKVQFGDPKQALFKAKAEHFKGYLLWRMKNSRIKKESSILVTWLTLSMLFAQTAKRYINEGILYDIRNNGHWVRDKEVFPHERLRIQLSTILILGACTSTRPGALIGDIPLVYSDLEFQVFPSPEQGHPTIVLVLNLKNIKRSGGKQKPKKYAFYEGENLICCPVLFTIALVLSDNAFKNKFTSLEQIYNLVIPRNTDRIRLRWDDKWAERPIFRDVEGKWQGVRLSSTKALTYAKHRHHFVRLGLTCSFRETLEFYDLRRASGKRLNEALTPEERKQIMGHRGNVYERHYMPSFIDRDCQAIYLGTTRRNDPVRAVGRLERHDLAPSHLNDAQKYEILIHPGVLELIEARERYGKKIKSQGLTYKQAAETPLGKKRKAVQAEINLLRQNLRRKRLKQAIDQFHESVHTLEVDRQLQGILPSSDILTPSNIEYELEERAMITKLLFQPLENLDDEQVYQLRIKLVQSLVLLSQRQEAPRSLRKATRPRIRYVAATAPIQENHALSKANIEEASESVQNVGTQAKVIAQPLRSTISKKQYNGPPLFYAFCKWQDLEASPAKKDHVYSRRDCLGRHIRNQHLRFMEFGEGFSCPQQGCSAFLADPDHFLSHTARQHGLFL